MNVLNAVRKIRGCESETAALLVLEHLLMEWQPIETEKAMLVKFNDPREFLEELTKDAERITRSIVRVTQQITHGSQRPIVYLSVVATAQVAGNVVRLERYCGELWRIEDQDRPVQVKAQEVMAQVQEGCENLGLEVRAGIITD